MKIYKNQIIKTHLFNLSMKLKVNYAEVLLCLSVFFIVATITISKEVNDSLIVPNGSHGLLLNDSTLVSISKENIQDINYTTLYDILNNEGNLFGMGLGINGHFNNFFSYGEISTNPSVLFNGRNLNNPINDNYNLELFSPEFVESIEILKGSNSVILSPTANSTTLNIQEIVYNTKTPFTRLWYSQEGGSFTGVDGLFSQNFAKGWNLTFGFKKISDRLTYDNMTTDLWNLRAIIRYNIDSNSSISLSDNFTNNKIISNGGLNPEESTNIYSPLSSNAYFDRIQDRSYRHDINLTYTGNYLDFKVMNIAYLTTNEQIFELPVDFYPDTLFDATYNQLVYGNRLDLEYSFSKFTLKSGGSISVSNSDKWLIYGNSNTTQWNLYSRLNTSVSKSVNISGGVNYGNRYGNSIIGFGERVTYKSENTKIYFDHSNFSRNSPFFNMLENENSNLFIAGINYNEIVASEVYFRNTTNALAYEQTDNIYFNQINLGNYSAIGGNVKLSSDITNNIFSKNDDLSISILGKFNYILDNDELNEYYPIAFVQGTMNYKLIVNQSELNLGVRAGIMSSKSTPRLLPVSNIYTNTNNSSNIQTTGLTFYSFMRLGNAVVKLDFENLFDAGYYYTSFYPERGQILKLSVAWSFFD